MCGICGDVRLDGATPAGDGVRAMLAAMVHRGPDAEGTFAGPGVLAGIRRLAVIDVAGGNQPIANEDGSVEVVSNGEIYNFAELRTELAARGHRFRTRSDTEVLVHLWEDEGPALLKRLNGMFAFCLHDSKAGRTFIARDRLGIKPLFYWLQGDRLVFASELRVLLAHPEVPREVDPEALIESFCLQFVAGERTIYRGIRELLPGHTLDIRDGRVAVASWWQIPPPDPGAADLESSAEELRELVGSSVALCTVADVPLGLFLSGGLDSSIVCAELARRLDHPVQTFSVGFEDAAAFDERTHARAVAQAFGAEHHELVVSATGIADRLPGLIEHLATPVTDPAFVPTWLLSEFARRKVTVVLTGEGADELFAGYKRYLYQQRLGWVGGLPGAARLGRALPNRLGQALSAVGETRPARNHLAWSATIGWSLAGKLFDSAAVARVLARLNAHFEPYFAAQRIRPAEQLHADQHEWLPHNLLAKVDRASMAHSLEARVPFLDHRIVEWAARLPDTLKIRGGVGKAVLREAYRGSVPAATLERPKQGFDLPLAAWIRGPLRPLAQDLIDGSAAAAFPALEIDAARRMLRQHLDGRQDHGLPLFLLLSMLIFLRRSA